MEGQFTLRDLAAVVSATVVLMTALFAIVNSFFMLRVEKRITVVLRHFVSKEELPGELAKFELRLRDEFDGPNGYVCKTEIRKRP